MPTHTSFSSWMDAQSTGRSDFMFVWFQLWFGTQRKRYPPCWVLEVKACPWGNTWVLIVQCSLMDVLKDETLSSPSVSSSELSVQTEVCRPEKEPYMCIASDSCCSFAPVAALCRTALQRVLTSLSMSSTESEDSVSYPSSSRWRLQGLSEALSAYGATDSLMHGSLTVMSLWREKVRA